MKKVLIVSPHFPPINAADHQRVRIAIPFMERLGWKPVVLAVDPRFVEAPLDPWLLKTLPDDLEVHHSNALPVHWTKPIGLSTLGPRCRAHLRKLGDQILREQKIDLIYFSTTQFPVHRLALRWERKFGVPFAMDLQDPWVNDYYRQHPDVRPPGGRLKYALSTASARRDEPRCLEAARAVTVVSGKYTTDLISKYPQLDISKFVTLPFGASERDFEVAARFPVPQSHINFEDGLQHWVSIGRGGDDMRTTLQGLFRAFRRELEIRPEFKNVRMHFLGTDYASRDRVRLTVHPIAIQEGIGDFVTERPERIPYSETLTCLQRANRLLITGSDDRGYNPSKVGTYLLSGRPILGILHEESPAVATLKAAGQQCVTFTHGNGELSENFFRVWQETPRPSCLPDELTAARMAKTLIDVFNRAISF